MANYRFSVKYTRRNSNGVDVDGRTLLSSSVKNFGAPAAEKRLTQNFKGGHVSVLSVEPYMSGSDLVKARRKDKADV